MSTNMAVLVYSGPCPLCIQMWPSVFTLGQVYHVYQYGRLSLLWDMFIMSTNVAIVVYSGTCPSCLPVWPSLFTPGISIMFANVAVLVSVTCPSCPSCIPMWPSLFTLGHIHHVYQYGRPSLLWDMSIISANVDVLVYSGACLSCLPM